ncbi:MAG: dTMP kinase [Bacillota bacterium]
MQHNGCFITFEGGEGVGKSTQLQELCRRLDRRQIDYIVSREPGGTPVGEQIRAILLSRESQMVPECEALLYAASRAQLVQEVIGPALNRGMVVICDRYVDSSLAYQGYGLGLGFEAVAGANALATGALQPDLTIVLLLPPDEGLRRRSSAGPADRIEARTLEFHRRVEEGYRNLLVRYPHRMVAIDASRPVEEMADEIEREVVRILESKQIIK